MRSNILSKLIFAHCCVRYCDTPIARITGCVSSLRMKVGGSPYNYSVACTRVNRVVLVSLCSATIKRVFEGDQI